jgi:hypothetical protein
MDGWFILEDDYLSPGYGILGRDCIEYWCLENLAVYQRLDWKNLDEI